MSEIESTNKAVATLANLSSGVGIMSTYKTDDFETKKAVLNAVTNAEPISDHLNEVINLSNYVAQVVTVTDEITEELRDVVRSILIDDENGKAYYAISDGITGSIRDLFGILGEPHTWTEPVRVIVTENKGRGARKFFKIVLA